MKCVKCGKKIQKSISKLCPECQKKLLKELKAEENKPKTVKLDDGKFSLGEKIFAIVCAIVIIVSLTVTSYTLIKRRIEVNKNSITNDNLLGKKIGNTIGNIRSYGYCAKEDDWIYYYAANEDFSKNRICRTKGNGASKSIIFEESNMEIYSLNAINGYIYFIGILAEPYSSNDEIDNKIYRMKNDGSNLEVINDNNFNDYSQCIYVIDDKIYFIGLDYNIYNMNLDGTDAKLVCETDSGFLGITDKYIIYDYAKDESKATYIANLDGSNPRPIIKDKKLSFINVENDYIYYLNDDNNIYRTQIDSGVTECLLASEAYFLNVYNNYAYYFGYTNSDATTVALYRIAVNAEIPTPEILKTLSKTSYYLDIVGEYANFLDANDERVTLNLFKLDGSLDNLELFIYNNEDVRKYYNVEEEEDTTSNE